MRVPLIGLRPEGESGAWARIAETIMRRPAIVAGITGGFLVLCALPAPLLSLTPGSSKGLPSQSQSVQGLELLERTLGPGTITPLIAVVDSGRAGGIRAAGPAIARLVERSARRSRGHDRADPDGAGACRPICRPTRTGRYARIVVATRARLRHGPGQEARPALPPRLRARGALRLRTRVRGRRSAGGRRLHRPRLRLVPVARARRARASPISCSCARSARCCCRSRP